MTLDTAFKHFPRDTLLIRRSKPFMGSYQIEWIRQLMDYKVRNTMNMGSFIKRFIEHDSRADDWEVATEYTMIVSLHDNKRVYL